MRRFGRGARYYSPFGPCLALLGPSFGCYRSFRALPAAATSVLCRWFAKAFVPSAASVGVVPLHLSRSGCRVERRGQTIVVLAHHAWRKRGEGRGGEEETVKEEVKEREKERERGESRVFEQRPPLACCYSRRKHNHHSHRPWHHQKAATGKLGGSASSRRSPFTRHTALKGSGQHATNDQASNVFSSSSARSDDVVTRKRFLHLHGGASTTAVRECRLGDAESGNKRRSCSPERVAARQLYFAAPQARSRKWRPSTQAKLETSRCAPGATTCARCCGDGACLYLE